jgi:hypothetical protein
MCNKLLEKNPQTRLGSRRGAREVKEHEWVRDMEWEKLFRKKITPPIDPTKNLVNFSPEFTEKPIPKAATVAAPPPAGAPGEARNSQNFAGWSFAETLQPAANHSISISSNRS